MLKELLGAFVQKKCLLVSSFTGRDTAYKVSTCLLKLPRRPYTLVPRSPPHPVTYLKNNDVSFKAKFKDHLLPVRAGCSPKRKNPVLLVPVQRHGTYAIILGCVRFGSLELSFQNRAPRLYLRSCLESRPSLTGPSPNGHT